MAPELLMMKPYQAQSVDMFALGAILFMMEAGTMPFASASVKDPHYSMLVTHRSDRFWAAHSEGRPKGFFSEEFKNLVTLMLSYQPYQRLSLCEVIMHPYLDP